MSPLLSELNTYIPSIYNLRVLIHKLEADDGIKERIRSDFQSSTLVCYFK